MNVLFIAKIVSEHSQNLQRFHLRDFRNAGNVALRTTEVISIDEEQRYENFKELAFIVNAIQHLPIKP